jgi:DNA-directed RNA polymerase I, II, and III subunit RPABC2
MESIRIYAKQFHPEVVPVTRDTVQTESRTTLPYLSKYEYTVLLGTRAQQLAEGAKPFVRLDGLNPADPRFIWKVAEREILEKKLPYILRRQLPNGTAEFWSVQECSVL